MRVCFVLFVVASILAISDAVFPIADNDNTIAAVFSEGTRSIPSNTHGTRFLRVDKAATTNANGGEKEEERGGPTMNYAGFFRDSKETRKWLQYWRNKNEPVTSVAARLGLYNLPQDVAVNSQNWAALVKYMKMSVLAKRGRRYAYFGTGYQTEAKTKEYLMRWAIADDSIEDVAKTLKVWGLTDAQFKVHRNYNAMNTFMEYRDAVKKMRAAHVAQP